MLRKLRRNSKEPIEGAQLALRSLSLESTPTLMDDDAPKISGGLTFFDLPAELRNEIYELVISDATLSLPCNTSSKARLALRRRKPLSEPSAINGLLLASRQCRQEYLSVLLSSISVLVEIKDFNFDNLIRVSTSLGEVEVRFLQANRNLTLLLDTRNCTTKDMAALRRWLDYRKEGKNQLPWKYEFPMLRHMPPSTPGRVRLMRELEYYADTISALAADIEDDQQAELSSVIAAFESNATVLEDSLGWDGQWSKRSPRNVRGLAGGGLL